MQSSSLHAGLYDRMVGILTTITCTKGEIDDDDDDDDDGNHDCWDKL
jgi:hypothetical protein